jgi:type IV secretory pathway TrbF-like protein
VTGRVRVVTADPGVTRDNHYQATKWEDTQKILALESYISETVNYLYPSLSLVLAI